MDDDPALREQRVIVLAPLGRDSALTQSVLERAGITTVSGRSLEHVGAMLDEGAGALVLAEEAVAECPKNRLADWIARQPPWSDLPVIVLARSGGDTAVVGEMNDWLRNLIVLERPTRVAALVSALRNALRARQRQYETRAHLAEIERSQRDLATSEERFRSIFETAGVSLWQEDFSAVKAAVSELKAKGVTDLRRYFAEHPDFVEQAFRSIRVLDVNEATVRMFEARDKNELLGALPKVFTPESVPVFVDELVAVTEGRAYFETEALLRTLRGRPIHVFFTMVLPDPGEPFDRVLFSVFDITARKRAEESLKEADRRKDEFVAILAHELRNPLAPIRNSLQILRLSSQQDATARSVAEMLERQVDHMVRLVDELLEVSRITRGKIELRKEIVEVATIVRSAVEASRPLMDAAAHHLAIALPSESMTVEADPVRLAQVFANLLNNAAKFTEPGGQIWLSVWRDGERVAISVRDSGVGMPPEMLPRVFDLFTQIGRQADRAHGGLGIGLTLVKSLVEMHGGSVKAHSDGPRRGSEFVVRLPLAAADHANRPPAGAERRQTLRKRHRVMVVDDNRDAADSLGMLLKLLGADVQVSFSGSDALRMLPLYRPEIVVLDIGMPEMDGHEVARRVRQQPEFRDVTLIALTGWGQADDRERSRAAGFNHHLIKPADINTIRALIDSVEGDT